MRECGERFCGLYADSVMGQIGRMVFLRAIDSLDSLDKSEQHPSHSDGRTGCFGVLCNQNCELIRAIREIRDPKNITQQ